MSLEKWWSVDTIFVTLIGTVMAVVLSASIFARPHISKSGSALVPAAVLQNARAQQVQCETVTDDADENVYAHTRC